MAWIKVWRASVRLSSLRICHPSITYNHHAQRGLAESSANHYDILGLKSTASQSQIKSAYYQLSKKYHPDVAVDVDNAKEKFARLNAAYEVLSNPDTRASYDRTLHPSMGRYTTYTPSSDIDIEYREFLRRRGTFPQRTSGHAGHASSRTAGRARFDYEQFFRQQHYERTRTMRQNWEAQKNFEERLRQRQAASVQMFWIFVFLTLGIMAVGSASDSD